jgi:hypothetical protein
VALHCIPSGRSHMNHLTHSVSVSVSQWSLAVCAGRSFYYVAARASGMFWMDQRKKKPGSEEDAVCHSQSQLCL